MGVKSSRDLFEHVHHLACFICAALVVVNHPSAAIRRKLLSLNLIRRQALTMLVPGSCQNQFVLLGCVGGCAWSLTPRCAQQVLAVVCGRSLSRLPEPVIICLIHLTCRGCDNCEELPRRPLFCSSSMWRLGLYCKHV